MLSEIESLEITSFLDQLVHQAFEAASLPDVVHHYTNTGGIQGIISSGKMWATNVAFLNDRKEYDHAIDLLINRLDVLSKGDIPRVAKDWSKNVFDRISEERYGVDPNFFVICFSERRDDLSQWRAYGSDGGGVALGFDAQKLADAVRKFGGRFSPVVYDSQIQEKAIDAALNWAVTCVHKIHEATELKLLEEKLEAWNLAFFGQFERMAPFFKDSAFEAEKEWRAVFKSKTIDELHFRARSDHLVPYLLADLRIEIAFTDDQMKWLKDQGVSDRIGMKTAKSADLLPLGEVIVGPSDRDLLSFRAMKRFLWANGYIAPGLSFSKTPYRTVK